MSPPRDHGGHDAQQHRNIGRQQQQALERKLEAATLACDCLRAGVSLLNALEIVAQTTGNALIEQAVRQVRVDIQEGEPLAKSLNEVEVFPPLVVKMVDAGEKTGAIDSMLSKIADFYEDEVDTAVATLTSVIEPIMIVIVGTIVGFVVISMFWPLFVMVTLIK